jgi:DNA-binding CsgD family transcriptional regulator/tetratricopeptide (TPR) repeat protein
VELLDRGVELRVLADALDGATQGRGAAVLIAGEAGIGKTTLLRAFQHSIGPDTVTWWGASDDLIAPRPLGVFHDMVRGARPPIEVLNRDSAIDWVMRQLQRERRPTVIVADDAQWADDASLDVIRYLARRIDDLPAVLCISYRPHGISAQHPLARIIGTLIGDHVHRIDLAGFSDATVTELAGQAGLEPASLLNLTGGNPFLVTEALRSPAATVPGPVRDVIVGRLNALSAEARSLAELMSQMPGGADWETLVALADGAEAGLTAVEEAALVEMADGTFRFRHELTRIAVDESLPDARRVALNRALLRHHAAHGAAPHRLIHHAARSADQEAIALYAVAAVEEAVQAGAHYDTERLARLALEREDLLSPEAVAALYGRAAYACYILNRFGDARRFADAAIDRWEAMHDADRLGDALLLGSRMHTMTMQGASARLLARRAVAVLEPLGPSRSLALAYSTVGNLHAIASEHPEAIEWNSRALAMADSLQLDDVKAHACTYLGIGRFGIGDDGGFADLRRAIELAEQAGHDEYLFRASMNLGAVLIWAGRHSEALEHIERAERVCRDAAIDYGVFHSVAQRCHVDVMAGRLDRAESDLRDLLAQENDPVGTLVLPLSLLGRVLIRQGDPDAAGLVTEAWKLATETGQRFRIANAGLARLEVAWHQDDASVVADLGVELLEQAVGFDTPYFEGEVRRYLRRVGVEVGSFDRCPPALAAGIQGDWRAAAELWAAQGAPIHRALELIESPERDVALEGLAMLDDLGATGTAAKVRQLLRGRGWSGLPRGPRPRTRDNAANLTPRQIDVLIHLTDGKTSIEIGDALYVSSRTVDNHVAEIVRKLGVANRREAVAAALDLGIVEAPATE